MAVVYLAGVLDDGTTVRDPAVPENPRTTLLLTQDGTTTIKLRITNPAGVPVPSSGALTLSIKKRPQDLPALATISGTWTAADGPGAATFSIPATALRGVEWGRYCYDILLATVGERNLVIPTSPVLLQPAVSLAS